MRIRNAKVYQPDGTFKTTDIVTEGERIHSGAPADGEIIDAYDLIAIPGLVDMNVTGADGHEFAEADPYAIREITRYLAGNGVTACAAVVPVFPEAHSEKVVKALSSYVAEEAPRRMDSGDLAAVVLATPLAHVAAAKGDPRDLADEDADKIRALAADADELVKAVLVNANEPGARELIKNISKDLAVALSADATTKADTEVALKDGASVVSHRWSEAYDAQAEDALVAALDRPGTIVELLADDLHEHGRTLASLFTEFGNRIALASDGKDFTLFDAMRRAIDDGVPANLAIDAATVVPARALRIEQSYGTLEDGRYANIVLVNDRFDIQHVIHRGQMII
jgi:N-acetylglucosamine-6-phosphate deacetylase